MTIERIIGSGGGCFKAGTQVQLKDGKTIAIELIKEGDFVLAFDEYNNIHSAKVVKLHVHEDAQPLLNVKFWNGEIFITPNHWVLNQYNSFVEIDTLTEHDAVVDGMGHLRPIISKIFAGNDTVYNLTVEPFHTFIANGIRVHNGGHRERFPIITGSGGGGGKKGGGGAPRQAVEASDTLQSKATISVIDLIGEGKIGGLTNGAKSIFLNNTALMSESGQYNFDATTFDSRNGSPNQSVIPGFSSIETPYSMSNIEFTTVSPKTFSITNLNVDRVRIIVSIAALTSQNMTTGDISGSSVTYRFQISVDGGAYSAFGSDVTISGKTKSKYQRSTVLTLPTATIGWTIKVIRVTADSTSAALQNKTYFDSYVELTDANLNYANSALISVNLDPTTFSSVPSRGYLVNGLYIQVPNNIGIDANGKTTGVYTGIWNGGFTTAISSNPAWILYDLLTSTRYGLGGYIGSAQVDKSMLYTIGKYCDQLVDDGFGGFEPRFSINTQLQTQAEAYKIISDITSVFRGMAYWNGGMVCFRQDSPATPSMAFNQANVVNGEFNYTSSSRRDRHSVVNVTWNDPDYGYKQRVEYVEDHDLVNSAIGIKKVDTVAFGCSSRGQAQRVGRWILYSEKYESNVITFNVGLDSSLLFPGEIVRISDAFRAGKRAGGRILSCSSTSVTLDSPVTLSLGSGSTAVASVSIFIAMADGSFVERVIAQTTGVYSTLTWTTPLTILPLDNALFVLSDEVVPMLARIVSVAQDGKHADSFVVSAVEHNPSKFGAIESGLVLTKPKTGITPPYVMTLSNLTITESTYFIAPGIIGSKAHVSWDGQASVYSVSQRISKTASKVLITQSASNVLTTSIDHGLTTGVPVSYYFTGTTISGLSTGTIYYAVVLTSATFKLATTNANAIAATPIVITLGTITASSTYYIASANPIIGNWYVKQVNVPSFDIDALAQSDILDVKVSGLDLFGVWSTPITATLTVAGKSAPPKPVATFSATGLIRSIQLTWAYPVDMDIDFDHVNIRWSSVNLESGATLLTSTSSKSHLATGLNFASTPYYFWIKTVDTSGNESTQSVYATASTLDEAGAMVTTLNGMLGSSALNAELGTRLSSASDSFDPFQTWYFTATSESWTAVNASLTWSSTGIVTLTSTAANAQLISPAALSVVGSTYLIVKAKVNRLAGTTGWSGSLYYKTTGAWTLAKTIVMPYGLNTVGNSALLEFNMIGITGWTSTTAANPITQIRLDIGSTTASGDSFSIDWIGIGRSAPGSSSQALVAAQSSINGLNASYTVKIDANGYVAGYGLASETNTAGVATSSFAIRADKFSIANPNGPGQSAPIIPFSVLTTPTTIDGSIFPAGVYIDTAYITKITADKIDSRGLSIRDAFGNIILGSGNALDWNNIGGAAKPADNATNTTVYSQNIAPASPHEGDIWYVNDTLSGYIKGAVYIRKSSAWVKTADATISQLGGSGVNILDPRYATFEESILPPFSAHASGTLTQDTANKYFGSKSLKIATTGVGGFWTGTSGYTTSIQPNKKWIISAYVYSDTNIVPPVWGTAGIHIGIQTVSANAYYGTNYYDGVTSALTIPGGQWTRIYGVLDLTADSNTNCLLRIDSHATGKNVWFDGIMLEVQVGDLKTPSVYQEPINFLTTYVGDLNATRNVYKGSWATATAYIVGDIVLDAYGYGWSCVAVHTSGAIVTPTYPVTGNANWTLYAVKGVDAISVIVSNDTHTLPAASDGTVSSYVDSGTTIQVFDGTQEVIYNGVGTTNGTWKVTAAATNVTVGTLTDSGNYLTVGVQSGVAAGIDTASIVYTITGLRFNGSAISVTAQQSFSKSKAGAAGVAGVAGVAGATGAQGPSALMISNRAASFTATDGTLDASQADIIFTTQVSGVTSPTYVWTFSGFQTSPANSAGATQTITAAQFGTSKSAIVTCTVSGVYADNMTIVRLEKTTAAAGATVGATFGAGAGGSGGNINGSINSTNISTYIANAAIGSAQIGSINLVGNFNVKSATAGQRMEMDATVIKVYDAAGTLRVKLGNLA